MTSSSTSSRTPCRRASDSSSATSACASFAPTCPESRRDWSRAARVRTCSTSPSALVSSRRRSLTAVRDSTSLPRRSSSWASSSAMRACSGRFLRWCASCWARVSSSWTSSRRSWSAGGAVATGGSFRGPRTGPACGSVGTGAGRRAAGVSPARCRGAVRRRLRVGGCGREPRRPRVGDERADPRLHGRAGAREDAHEVLGSVAEPRPLRGVVRHVDEERRPRLAAVEPRALAQLGHGVVAQVGGEVDVGPARTHGVEQRVAGPAHDRHRLDARVEVARHAHALHRRGSTCATRSAKARNVVGSASRPTRPVPVRAASCGDGAGCGTRGTRCRRSSASARASATPAARRRRWCARRTARSRPG